MPPAEELTKVLADAKERIESDTGCPVTFEMGVSSPVGHIQGGWFAFPQMWPSTALGFPQGGASALTTAQTYVVESDRDAYVYFGARFAYKMARADARENIQALRMPPVPR